MHVYGVNDPKVQGDRVANITYNCLGSIPWRQQETKCCLTFLWPSIRRLEIWRRLGPRRRHLGRVLPEVPRHQELEVVEDEGRCLTPPRPLGDFFRAGPGSVVAEAPFADQVFDLSHEPFPVCRRCEVLDFEDFCGCFVDHVRVALAVEVRPQVSHLRVVRSREQRKKFEGRRSQNVTD